MIRNTLKLLQQAPKAPAQAACSTLGFPRSREVFTELPKKEPLENYAGWDTQRYVNKGVCFYDLISNCAPDRIDRDDANKKPHCH